MNNEFGTLIKQHRLQKQLSQDSLARLLERDRSWIAHIERGDFLPSAEQIVALAEGLSADPDMFLLTSQLAPVPDGEESRMSRQVVRQFSSSWRGGRGADMPRAGCGTQGMKLLMFLNHQVADVVLRTKLKRLGLGCLEVAHLALELLEKGAQWARLSWAQVGFPVALLDGDNCCLNHLPRTCLVWADNSFALALFGETTASSPRYLPPVLTWISRQQRQYLALDGAHPGQYVGGKTDNKSSPLQAAEAMIGSNQYLRRVAVGGVERAQIGRWLNELMPTHLEGQCLRQEEPRAAAP